MSKKRNKKRPPKRTLALPNLEQSKAAGLVMPSGSKSMRAPARIARPVTRYASIKPRLIADRTSAAVFRTFNFSMMCIRWVAAVLKLISKRAAISFVLKPSAMRTRTPCSLRVSGSRLMS
jgi:hypothetical protein